MRTRSKFSFLLLLCLFTQLLLYSNPVPQPSPYANFDDNPFFTEEMKGKIRPYLLPLEHPTKKIMDRLFKTRVTLNLDALRNAGFKIVASRPISHILVVKHPDLKGYLIKLYLDSSNARRSSKPTWELLLHRCIGVKIIRDIIKQHKLKHFIAPKKWIYPLPVNPTPPPGFHRHLVVLLVQRMPIASNSKSKDAWRRKVTKDHLNELYQVLKHGYASSYLHENIPYCSKGQFAIIDTDRDSPDPKFERVDDYLSRKMRAKWDRLMRKRGKRR